MEEALGRDPSGKRPEGAPDFLAGGGEMGALMRAKDWSKTPLGPVSNWPQSLKTVVSTCLNCSFPILIWWGRDLIKLYNDAYREIIAGKHPKALGQRGSECWPEIWHIIGPMLTRVIDEGRTSPADDLQLRLVRSGYPEECYFSFSYSPIHDETGGIGGVFTPVIETTEKIIGARRLETLRELAALPHADSAEKACREAAAVLAKNGHDVPFALVYLLSEEGSTARLAATSGIEAGTPESPLELTLESNAWPFGAALERPALMKDMESRRLPAGDWSELPEEVYLAPILLPGAQKATAVLIAGLNPHKRLDRSYRSFLDLLTAQMSSTIADALAYEAERKRAEALAELDRAKTAFFSNVSHEFRTPLTLMLGPLEEALSDSDTTATPSQRGRLEVAHRNSLRLLKLVNSLLDFSRIEAGRAQASYEPVDLAALTAELASNFRSATERAGLALVIDCPALSEPVFVDRDMWEQIVLNLLSNAFKFTFAGEITVTLGVSGEWRVASGE